MAAQMKIKSASGVVLFDSLLADGGVPIDFYTIPAGGGTFSSPAFADATSGVALVASGGIGVSYTVDKVSSPVPALRFTFPANAAGAIVLLFAK